MKRLLTFLAIISLFFALVGCSGDKKETAKESETKETTEETTKLTEQTKTKMYNALRVAELKVNEIFAKEVAEDGTTPIINSSFQTEEAVVAFLSDYYSEEIVKEMYAYYVTGQKTAEGQVIVKEEPFFTPSVLETTKEDVTTEGDAKKATIKTKDNVTYTVELNNNQYLITRVQK